MLTLEKFENDYAVVRQNALTIVNGRLRSTLEFLRSGLASKAQTIHDFRNLLANLTE